MDSETARIAYASRTFLAEAAQSQERQRTFYSALKSMQEAGRVGIYIDPINKHKADYVAGRIEIEEFERRVGLTLGLKP